MWSAWQLTCNTDYTGALVAGSSKQLTQTKPDIEMGHFPLVWTNYLKYESIGQENTQIYTNCQIS